MSTSNKVKDWLKTKGYMDGYGTDYQDVYDEGFDEGVLHQQGEVDKLQDKIDELQRKYDAMYNAFVVADDCRKEWHRCYVGVRQREDDLQIRIDKALVQINNHKDSCQARKRIKHMSASLSEIAEIEAHESNMCVLEGILK